MPGIEDWVNCPLQIIQTLFAENKENYESAIEDYFNRRLQDNSALSMIPSLNDVALDQLRTGTLIRYRCMIQDMFDPEFYLGVYESRNNETGSSRLKLSKYRDLADCGPDDELLMESAKNITMERQTFYCVPVPAETAWVKDTYSLSSKRKPCVAAASPASGVKRELDTAEPMVSCAGDIVMDTQSSSESDPKKLKTSGESGGSSTTVHSMNFPLPEECGTPCLVKVYENTSIYKLNDVFEFIGVLCTDPELAHFPDSEREHSSVDPADNLIDIEEEKVRCPPPSLVPRLHVLLANKLAHVNPHLHRDITKGCKELKADARALRSELLAVLESVLLGDRLAAKYILCHLLSTVYTRKDVVAVGKFSLNLIGCPAVSGYIESLCTLLQSLVTKLHYFPMTLAKLNESRFVPQKDYSANRLLSGILQLSEHTHVVLDETVLDQGQLDAKGVRNITALGNVITWQKLDYDFNFHKQEFTTNLPVLVLSEGKSILPSECPLKLVPSTPLEGYEVSFKATLEYLTPALLTRLRQYLTCMRLLTYTVEEDIHKAIQEDFVESRKTDKENMTVEGFHSLLVLARLLSLSNGDDSLQMSTWDQAKTMERARKLRLI